MPEGRRTTRAATRSAATSRATRRSSACSTRIRFGEGVAARAARADGGWELELESGERERFDMLVVANGHNEEAKWPDPPYPGEFEGRQLHALDYAEADEFRDQNVLVVGMGNSAMDIATDISLVADRTYLSARHGTWVIPKRLLGQPADQIIKPWVAVHVPWRIRQPLSQFLLRLTVGPPERYGLPEPSRGLFQDHPTITDTVLSRISHGELTPKPGIDTLAPGAVTFTDGSEEPVDAIVWCTGYRVSMPFLDDVADRARPEGAPALQADLPPRLPGPLLRRPDAVHRLRLPDRRAPGADPRRAPGRRMAPAAGRRPAARLRAQAPRTRSRAGASTAGRRCAWTSTASCTSSGASSSSGARGRPREPAGARDRRERRLRHRAPRRAARARLVRRRPRPRGGRRRGDRLRRHRRRGGPARRRDGRAAARRAGRAREQRGHRRARPAPASRRASASGR